MHISIAKMERDVYIHIFYYLVLYTVLIIAIIDIYIVMVCESRLW